MWLRGLLFLSILVIANCVEADSSIEAAFQGRCGHGSPCVQLCYELHDGMYECDCEEGYELDKNGYSCQEINSTYPPNDEQNTRNNNNNAEDVLYQKGASFSAKLDNSHNINNHLDDNDSSDDNDSDENFVNSVMAAADDDASLISVRRIHKQAAASVTTSLPSSNDVAITSVLSSSSLSPQQQLLSSQLGIETGGISYSYSGSKTVDMSVFDDVNNNRLNLPNVQQSNDHQMGVNSNEESGKDSVKSYIHIEVYKENQMNEPVTKLPDILAHADSNITIIDKTANSRSLCQMDCGVDVLCEKTNGVERCLCPYGKTGIKCEQDIKISVPRFAKKSWMAFSALRGAYKHVQLHIEFRPETFNGIILLTGERDDLTGDFMAVLIHQGFIEFWFDCGSGTGKVRSEETVVLNQWNTVTVYRHRWDAWLLLNEGSRVQGRSKGLFSRITFREPVFLGGTGNITGLAKRLPVYDGMTGCIRKFIANEHEYGFNAQPNGDITQGFDVQECTTDRCGKYPCRHDGKCLPSDQGAICLCPLGFGGDLCEMRLDLQVPSFNGSSYLRFAPLGDSSLIWFELKMVIKPLQEDGLLLYSGHHEYGDYISLYLHMGFVEFSFDLGSGPAVVRSEVPLSLGKWHTINISRTARLAVLKVDQLPEVMTISSNGFWHLSLPHSLYLGGVQNFQTLPASIRDHGSFIGCIQKVEINGRQLSIISEALGGTNVDNCPHACVARPCGPLAKCVPILENYECQCNPSSIQCNKAEELPSPSFEPPTVPPKILSKKKNNDKVVNQISPKRSNVEYQRTLELQSNEFGYNVTGNDSTIAALSASSSSKQTLSNISAGNTGDGDVTNSGDGRLAGDNGSSNDNELNGEMLNDDVSDDDYDDDYYYDNVDENVPGNEDSNDGNYHVATKTTETERPGGQTDNILLTSSDDRTRFINENFPKKMGYSKENGIMSNSDDGDSGVTRVLGKYMFVDNEELMRKTKLQGYSVTKDNYDVALNSPPANRKSVKKMNKIPSDNRVLDNMSADHQQYNIYSGEDVLSTKQLIDDMERIMKNGNDIRSGGMVTPTTSRRRTKTARISHGACFTGTDSYFHYNDEATMRHIDGYKIDLNLRFKTHSNNGLILWTGRRSSLEGDDFLSLGIENGYLHLRYNLGSGEANIEYNSTKVSDGLWHRIRAIRNSQEHSLEVDGGKTIIERSPGTLQQLNTDTGLYVGGMPDVYYYTRRKYVSGIIGCLSEIVLAGELRLSLRPDTLGTAHNVEPALV